MQAGKQTNHFISQWKFIVYVSLIRRVFRHKFTIKQKPRQLPVQLGFLVLLFRQQSIPTENEWPYHYLCLKRVLLCYLDQFPYNFLRYDKVFQQHLHFVGIIIIHCKLRMEMRTWLLCNVRLLLGMFRKALLFCEKIWTSPVSLKRHLITFNSFSPFITL